MTYRSMPDARVEELPDPANERRAEDRHLTVYRMVKVLRAEDAGLWRVRNISNRGMLLETGTTVVPEEKLRIVLSSTIRLRAHVQWVKERQCGLLFEAPIDVGQTLRRLVAEQESEYYRPLRLRVRCSGRLRIEDTETPILVNSISQSGVGFASAAEPRQGNSVELALSDDVWRRGNIRWSDRGLAGLQLASPFRLSEIGSVRQFL